MFYIIPTPMAKLPKRKIKRRNARVLMSMDGRGMRDGWVTLKLPAWLAVGLVVAVAVVCVALVASPELAAKLAALLAELVAWPPTHKP
jgi:hypothetical protein